MLPRRFSSLLLPLSLVACEGSALVGQRPDAADAALPDAPDDLGLDATSDVAPDAAPDVPRDAAPDGMDAPEVTVAPDVPADAGPDADAALDARDAADAGDVADGEVFVTVDVPLTGPVLPRPGRSSAVVTSPDDRVAVAVNRATNSVSVFTVTPGIAPAVLRLAEVPTGVNSDPWHAAMAPDGNTAYVVLRRAQQVIRLDNLRTGSPVVAMARATTGSEPTSMALSPTGRTLYVSNWGDGTLSVVNTATMVTATTLDLNTPLAATGFVGPGVAGRRGLAHPRAIVMTNNGDTFDDDEVLFVTEFFAKRRLTGAPTGLDRFDQDHQGVVYRMPVATRAVTVHTIAPAADMGFRAADGTVAGCYPNQLHAAAIAQGRVFITGTCVSPRGPVGAVAPPPPADGGVDGGTDAAVDRPDVTDVADVTDVPDAPPPIPPLDPAGANFRSELTGAVYVLDVATGNELVGSRVLLTQRYYALYDTRRDADDASRRMPLHPVDIDFMPVAGGTAGSTVAYVAAHGADGVFRVTFNTAGAFVSVGSTTGNAFTDLGATRTPAQPGSGPYGVATLSTANGALTINEFTRNVSAVEFAGQSVTGTAESSAIPAAAAPLLRGRRFFATGLGRWSFKGQAWNSCESCHPDGLTDNVTWFFARGPRQTISLDGTFEAGTPRIMNWTGVFDEFADFELNTRGNSGGVGAVVHRRNDGATPPNVTNADRIVFDGTAAVAPQRATAEPNDGLSGSVDGVASPLGSNAVRTVLEDWNEMRAWAATLRAPRAPTGLTPADVTAGRMLFQTHNCAGCHGGARWSNTARFYAPSVIVNNRTTGNLLTTSWTRPANFPAAVMPAMGTFRLSPFDAANDQITCVLRNVGTWAMNAGVAPAGVGLLEVRANMAAVSQGATGFAPPSLLGAARGAPYLHAGNARSLEELFSDTFNAHHRAYSPTFLANAMTRAAELRQIIAFLLSIDSDTPVIAAPARVTLPGTTTAFDTNPCAQYR